MGIAVTKIFLSIPRTPFMSIAVTNIFFQQIKILLSIFQAPDFSGCTNNLLDHNYEGLHARFMQEFDEHGSWHG